jgi:hypothetical protein
VREVSRVPFVLMAELALVLTLIGLGSQSPSAKPSPTTLQEVVPPESPRPEVADPEPPKQSTPEPPKQATLSPKPAVGDIPVQGASDQQIREEVATLLESHDALERRAAIVITFGSAPTYGDGSGYAARVNDVIRREFKDVFESAPRLENLWDGFQRVPFGHVQITIYFFT